MGQQLRESFPIHFGFRLDRSMCCVIKSCWDNFSSFIFSLFTFEGGFKLAKKAQITIRSSAAEYLTYIASTGAKQESIEMRYEDENIWLSQKMMALLYDVDVRTINYHIKKIFADSELSEGSVIRNFRITMGSRCFSCTALLNVMRLLSSSPRSGRSSNGIMWWTSRSS